MVTIIRFPQHDDNEQNYILFVIKRDLVKLSVSVNDTHAEGVFVCETFSGNGRYRMIA